ncbi:unnamed protein product [Bubo scandiacus]
MPCVHYRFSSLLQYDTVTFSGLHISLGDLKRHIMGRQKLKVTNCELQISNAQTGEEYTDDNTLIPKNSSVIVRRVPVRGVKTTSKTRVITRTEPASGTPKAIEDSSAPTPLAQLIKTSNLAEANASEEDKIRAMMIQSCRQYDPIKEAYARGKEEKPPFLPAEPSSSSFSSDDPIPEELLCCICKEIMADAVTIPCCGNSYCDECIRTALLEREEHTCPTCHQAGVSPDTLVANKCLRQVMQ